MPALSDAPSMLVSGAMIRRSADSDPKYWPSAVTRGWSAPVAKVRIEVSPAGACGASPCHTLRTCAAADHGHEQKNQLAWDTGCVASSSWVTIPNDAPAPRSAQNRSE